MSDRSSPTEGPSGTDQTDAVDPPDQADPPEPLDALGETWNTPGPPPSPAGPEPVESETPADGADAPAELPGEVGPAASELPIPLEGGAGTQSGGAPDDKARAAPLSGSDVGQDAPAPLPPGTEVSGAGRGCPDCGEPADDEAKWCEACGGDLTGSGVPPLPPVVAADAPSCVSCGADASEMTGDGYCSQCGYKQPAERDHTEKDLGRLAGVSDKGKRHRRNEDSFAIASTDAYHVMVACDGVSTTDDSDAASQLAADTAAAAMVEALEANAGTDMSPVVMAAIESAQEAVAALPASGDAAASCTIVAAAVQLAEGSGPALLTMGWLGDSRGYWVDAQGVDQVTVDHSWAVEQVRAGAMSLDEAMARPEAHSITRWLGADAVDLSPEVVSREVADGRVLVCSDGLWNYAADSEQMAALIAKHDEFAETAAAIARSLTAFANESGGHDNITVLIGQV